MKINPKLQQFFFEEFNLAHSLIGGRANVVLYSIFKTLPIDSKVVFPAVMCPSPLFIARSAGLTPVLCDVEAKTGLINDVSLDACLNRHKNVSAVVSVNLFGMRPDNSKLSGLCRSQNIMLIEDAAQGWSPNSLGANVDVSVLSFGRKKTFDCNGGGLAVTRNSKLFEQIFAAGKNISFTPNNKINILGSFYEQMYYTLQGWERVVPGAQKAFVTFYEPIKELYFKDMKGVDPDLILNQLNNYHNELFRRFELAKKYQDFFAGKALFECFMRLEPNVGPWRYGVLYKGQNREKFMGALREKSIDVSSWYPSLEKLGFESGGLNLRNAHQFGEEIINLWVSEIDGDKFSESLDIIEKFKE